MEVHSSSSAEDLFRSAENHAQQGDFPAATQEYRNCLKLQPDHFAANMNLGNALRACRDFAGAIESFIAARDLQPKCAGIWSNLGSAYLSAGQTESAIASHRQAVELELENAAVRYNYANALRTANRLLEAEQAFRRTMELDPQLAMAHNNLGTVLLNQGRVSEASESFLQANQLDPGNTTSTANYLMALHYDERVDPHLVFLAHQSWGNQQQSRVAVNPSRASVQSADRRLRIGYLSPDFRRHAVASFFEPILENHNRSSVETVCYANVADPDEVTETIAEPIRSVAGHFWAARSTSR